MSASEVWPDPVGADGSFVLVAGLRSGWITYTAVPMCIRGAVEIEAAIVSPVPAVGRRAVYAAIGRRWRFFDNQTYTIPTWVPKCKIIQPARKHCAKCRRIVRVGLIIFSRP
jgi:hypothetical protein